MIHWSCEECLVRAICNQPCEEVDRHDTMEYVVSIYGNTMRNVMVKHIAKHSPFIQYMLRTGKWIWIES